MKLAKHVFFGLSAMILLSATPLFPQNSGWQRDDLILNPSGLDLFDAVSWAWGDLNDDDIADVILLRKEGIAPGQLELWRGVQNQNPPYWVLEPGFFETVNDSVPEGVSLADLDGDGLPNLITSRHTRSGKRLLYWQREPNGIWQPDTTFFAGLIFTPPEPANSDPSFADVDEDGDMDMLIRDSGDEFPVGTGFRFFANVGTVNIPIWQEDTIRVQGLNDRVPPGFDFRTAVLMHANDDDIEDILVEGLFEFNAVYFFYPGFQDSSGVSWRSEPDEELKIDRPDHGSRKLWAFDIDGNGSQDLLHLERGGTARIFLTGTSQTKYFDPNYFRLGTIGFSSDNFQVPAFPTPFDYNRDGKTEILAVGFFYDAGLIYGNDAYEKDNLGTRELWRNTHWFTIPLRSSTNSSHSFSDIDQNDKMDFVISGFTTSISKPPIEAYENPDVNLQDDWGRKDGLVARFRRGHPDTLYFDQAFSDLDGDGDPDILITELIRTGADSGKTRQVFFENHVLSDSIIWTERPDWRTGLPATVYTTVTFADLDSDGDIDLIFGTEEGMLVSYENIGNNTSPTWRVRSDIFTGIDVGTFASPAFADLDTDGKLDLLVGNGAGEIIFFRNVTTVGIDPDKNDLPLSFKLHPNYPNPFNPQTTIEYEIAEAGNVTLIIYNLLGQKIQTVVNQWQPAGQYRVKWDGRAGGSNSPVASGIYLYELKIGDDRIQRQKMLLLR